MSKEMQDKLDQAAQLHRQAQELEAEAKKLKDEARRAERQRLREEESRKINEFKARLFEEHDVTNNPKVEKLWNHAWDLGHSNGLSDVECYFSELVDLIKD